MMKEENLLEKGHLQVIKNKLAELENFHYQLMDEIEETEYQRLFLECGNDLMIYK